MNHIAVLLTCFNRKDITLKALSCLYAVYKASTHSFAMDVYLTDDGSSDGTGEAVSKNYPEVFILNGTGNLFWAEGMRNSWREALKGNYDWFLLLNDDVELYPALFDQLFLTHAFCLKNFEQTGIYVGATEDKYNMKLTYSGSLITNRFKNTKKRLAPNGTVQKCDLANANILAVTKSVVEKIGIFPEGYSHGIADYDYTLTANRNNIPVLIAPEYCGHCVNDHKDLYDGFAEMTLNERRNYLYKPNGLALESYLKYMRKFFPFRYPLVAMSAWLKLYFPQLYLKYIRPR